ncbi:endoglucanase 2 [Nemania sp. FL0916]|nr:endoglucanase 2 [Nemania sp. FL0916]
MGSLAFVSLALFPAALAQVQFLGVAIAGGEFGCQINGTCPPTSAQLPLKDGPTQMAHFAKDDGFNLLRIPTSWQFLVNNQLGGDLDATNLSEYDQLVQSCLDTGAQCMIDIHNFARWDGQIIGQGGPTDEQFASFWGQLAGKYATNDKIIFELMNEPHDLDVGIWAQTCRKAVAAIRKAGATSQMILLPGTDFDSAATLASTGGADALLAVTNPDGSTDNLLLDIHKYLDEDNSGTHAVCSTNNVDTFTALALYLRSKGRRGFISETGASSDPSCSTAFCSQNSFINANSDVFAGLVAWGAGSFDPSYVLSLTPSDQDGRLVDSALISQCLLAPWNSAHSDNGSPSATSIATSTLLPSPTAIITASPISPTAKAPDNGGSSVKQRPVIDTSNVLIITDTQPQSTLETLVIETGTPPPRSGAGALLTPQTDDPFPIPTLVYATPSPSSDGVGSVVVRALALWSCLLMSTVLLL